MDLKTYLSELDRGGKSKFADSIGISISYLSQLSSGLASISPARCTSIEKATDGKVTRRDLRPDDWQEIWPELANSKHP